MSCRPIVFFKEQLFRDFGYFAAFLIRQRHRWILFKSNLFDSKSWFKWKKNISSNLCILYSSLPWVIVKSRMASKDEDSKWFYLYAPNYYFAQEQIVISRATTYLVFTTLSLLLIWKAIITKPLVSHDIDRRTSSVCIRRSFWQNVV